MQPPREYLDYLMDNVILSPQEDATLTSTTLGQLKHYFRFVYFVWIGGAKSDACAFSSLILSAIRGDEERLLAIIRSCTGSKAFNIPSEQTNHGDLRLDSVVCLFDALTTGHSRSQYVYHIRHQAT